MKTYKYQLVAILAYVLLTNVGRVTACVQDGKYKNKSRKWMENTIMKKSLLSRLYSKMNYPAASGRGIFKSNERPKGRGIKPKLRNKRSAEGGEMRVSYVL